MGISTEAPASQSVGGVAYEDRFVWLEEDSPAALAFQAEHDELAARELGAWPHLDALAALLEQTATAARVDPLLHHGRRWFQLAAPPDGGHPVLRVAGAAAGPWTDLVDPRLLDPAGTTSIDYYQPSPDGTRVAVGVSPGGSEQSTLCVVAADGSGEVVPRLANCPHAVVCWLPDSSGLYVNRVDFDETQSMEMRAVLLRMDGTVVPLPKPAGTSPLVFPQLSRDGRHLLLRSGLYTALRPTHILDVAAGGDWRPFLGDVEVAYAGVVAGDAYYAVTTDGAPRGQVVRIPLDTPQQRETWSVVVPESDAVVRAVQLAGDRLVLSELVDACSRIRMVGLDGTPAGEVDLPPACSAEVRVAEPDGDELLVTCQGFTHSPSVLRHDRRSGATHTLIAPRRRLDGAGVERFAATANDGTAVPYWVVRAESRDTALPQPALIHGYGGFNTPFVPVYNGAHAAFVHSGGALVLPCLRGGGEFGERWWQGGRMAGKRQTFDDLFAVAEDAVARGIASGDRLAMWGASNGGLLAGAAVALRPDLFTAVFAAVPVLDMMHIMRDPFTAEASRSDYGDPADPAMAPVMFAYSPYHNLRDGVAYPATLVAAGENDVRCRPWHSRKFVARLEQANAATTPALLRMWTSTGHGTGRTARSDVAQTAEWLGFLMRHLGMAPEGAL